MAEFQTENRINFKLLLFVLFYLSLCYCALLDRDEELRRLLVCEDGVIEYLG